MALGYLGSSQSPSWTGWAWPGAGYIFGSKYTTPNFDIKVTQIAAYFNTYQGSGALGSLAIFRSDNHIYYNHQFGIINNGTLNAGGQQWWLDTVVANSNVIIPANTVIWICGYSNQNLVFSTYDTSPHAFDESNGTGGANSIGAMHDTGQGPCGAYIQYSPMVYAGQSSLGGSGGLGQKSGVLLVTSGSVPIGMRAPSGLATLNADVLPPGAARMGNNGGGLKPVSDIVKVPTLRVWRPN